ncbi:MAG TPA: hypothetical protein VEA38_25480 [Terriglobales bacterium]|nr:hypothetical protein [Terriglobales bacterium]
MAHDDYEDERRKTVRLVPLKVPACGHTEGPLHDCATVTAINALIKEAEFRVKRDVASGVSGHPDALFHRHMELLADENGLRRTVQSALFRDANPQPDPHPDPH